MELLNINLKLLLEPMDQEPVGIAEVKGEFQKKSPSERLRGCLYRLWEDQTHNNMCAIPFEDFYRKRMESIIQVIKDQLPKPEF